jgi:hypothetical protein
MIKTYFPSGGGSGGSTFNCTLDVESSEGASVTVTGPDSFSGTIGSTGVIEFAITNPGSYTCTAILDSNTKTTTVDIETNGITYTADCSFYHLWGFIEHMATTDPASRIEYTNKNANYTPLTVHLASTHVASYGGWSEWPWLLANKPYMVKNSGEVDYELSSSNYTKKVDGTTASDVNNTSYAGGAFSWSQKLYKKETISGTDRCVIFSDYHERSVSLSAMSATGVGESHVAQTVTFVLMNAGGKTLSSAVSSGRTTCSFIVGMKNFLSNGTTGEYGYMNSSNTNSGGWDSCARRTWCNSIFKSSLPSTLLGCFKQFQNITANGSGSTTVTSTDYFALPSEKEIFGSITYANSTAETSNTQFTYYATSANRIKYTGNGSGSADDWWERSPRSGYSSTICEVYYSGAATNGYASNPYGISPFGCI